jgi:hypothetical protein
MDLEDIKADPGAAVARDERFAVTLQQSARRKRVAEREEPAAEAAGGYLGVFCVKGGYVAEDERFAVTVQQSARRAKRTAGRDEEAPDAAGGYAEAPCRRAGARLGPLFKAQSLQKNPFPDFIFSNPD